jgi:mannose-6-phosphate isomerase
MGASDNVLRGGLTVKHVDVPELVSVLDFTPVDVPYLTGERIGDGVTAFRPPLPDFQLVVVEGDGEFAPPGPAILICTAGRFEVTGEQSAALSTGESAYAVDEGLLQFRGQGRLFIATTQ